MSYFEFIKMHGLGNDFVIIDNRQNLIKIKKIPMPRPIYINKVRVPASYLNFYIFNKFVLLPTFNDPKDKIVIKIFKKY